MCIFEKGGGNAVFSFEHTAEIQGVLISDDGGYGLNIRVIVTFQDGIGMGQPPVLNVFFGRHAINGAEQLSEIGFRHMGAGNHLRDIDMFVENMLFQVGQALFDEILLLKGMIILAGRTLRQHGIKHGIALIPFGRVVKKPETQERFEKDSGLKAREKRSSCPGVSGISA